MRQDLAVEFPAFQQPHQKEEVCEFDRGLEQLCWLKRLSERRSGNGRCQRIGESYAPPVMSFLSVAAPCGEAADASDGVSEGEAGGECVASAERRHVMFTH